MTMPWKTERNQILEELGINSATKPPETLDDDDSHYTLLLPSAVASVSSALTLEIVAPSEVGESNKLKDKSDDSEPKKHKKRREKSSRDGEDKHHRSDKSSKRKEKRRSSKLHREHSKRGLPLVEEAQPLLFEEEEDIERNNEDKAEKSRRPPTAAPEPKREQVTFAPYLESFPVLKPAERHESEPLKEKPSLAKRSGRDDISTKPNEGSVRRERSHSPHHSKSAEKEGSLRRERTSTAQPKQQEKRHSAADFLPRVPDLNNAQPNLKPSRRTANRRSGSFRLPKRNSLSRGLSVPNLGIPKHSERNDIVSSMQRSVAAYVSRNETDKASQMIDRMRQALDEIAASKTASRPVAPTISPKGPSTSLKKPRDEMLGPDQKRPQWWPATRSASISVADASKANVASERSPAPRGGSSQRSVNPQPNPTRVEKDQHHRSRSPPKIQALRRHQSARLPSERPLAQVLKSSTPPPSTNPLYRPPGPSPSLAAGSISPHHRQVGPALPPERTHPMQLQPTSPVVAEKVPIGNAGPEAGNRGFGRSHRLSLPRQSAPRLVSNETVTSGGSGAKSSSSGGGSGLSLLTTRPFFSSRVSPPTTRSSQSVISGGSGNKSINSNGSAGAHNRPSKSRSPNQDDGHRRRKSPHGEEHHNHQPSDSVARREQVKLEAQRIQQRFEQDMDELFQKFGVVPEQHSRKIERRHSFTCSNH